MSVTDNSAIAPPVTIDDFLKLDVRVGTVTDVQPFPEARKPAFKVWVDFGDAIGIKKTSAQITQNHPAESLIGQQVAAVVNFPPRQVGPFMSEILILGFPDEQGFVTLVHPAKPVPNGGRLF